MRPVWRIQFVCLSMIFVFFFQAEDGIRDATVTGVQTCALPISHTLNGNVQRPSKDQFCGSLVIFSTSPRMLFELWQRMIRRPSTIGNCLNITPVKRCAQSPLPVTGERLTKPLHNPPLLNQPNIFCIPANGVYYPTIHLSYIHREH